MFNGFKTFLIGLTVAALPQMVAFVSDFDFVNAFGLSPNAATTIGLLIVCLRAMTSTPIFQKR